MVTQRPFNLTYAGLQLVTVAFLIVAVFLNQWIKGVRKDEEDNRGYFSRVEDLPFGLFVGGDFGGDFDDGIYSSVGLFRIIASGDTSYSLPIIGVYYLQQYDVSRFREKTTEKNPRIILYRK